MLPMEQMVMCNVKGADHSKNPDFSVPLNFTEHFNFSQVVVLALQLFSTGTGCSVF